MLRINPGVTQRGTQEGEMWFGSGNRMVQGGPRVVGESQARGGRSLTHFVGLWDMRLHDLLGAWEGSAAWKLNLFIWVLSTVFIWGWYKHPHCPQQFALNVFIDSFSYNFPQKPVVKLHSLLVINWSCCVDYPSHTGLISCHISLEIHL